VTRGRLELTVNGRRREADDVPHSERLLDTLRWRFGLMGTKEGCRTGDCGACTVLVDDAAVLSCLTLAHEVGGARVTTVEGAETDPVGRRVQVAFARAGALQCGYCTPGFVMALTGLLKERSPAPDAETLLEGLQGNLCRCTGYASIARAIRSLREDAP
jgi:carbon-monoxide dehydrogenase small subunit